jgi:hypothetical protein
VLFGALGIAVILGTSVFTAQRFISPLDKIEVGVGEVINGNIEHQFRATGDYEGLSNNMNVMLARLLGREDPNPDEVEEDDDGPKWTSEQMAIESGEQTPQVDASSPVAQENETVYYPRLFNEYLAGLTRAGQPVRGLSLQEFMVKLRLVDVSLRHTWNCQGVRFRLSESGKQVVLQAVRIA